MTELVDILSERGFEAVDAGLPGGWATDGEWTVCITTRQRGGGLGSRSTLEHEVVVYDEPAGLIAIGSQPTARARDTAHNAAVRRALDEAGFEEGGR